jgi:4-diphosphocytidyl-2C-methyl-D-erythritol kinase
MDQDNDGYRELETVMMEIKIGTERITSKLEQLSDTIIKLESSISRIDNALSSQEKRLIILEQSVPRNLLQDIALIKNAQNMQTKIIWLIGGAAISGWIKVFFDMLAK